MPLEPISPSSTPTDLVETNPTDTDDFSEGDNHIRNIKITLKNFYTEFNNRTKAQIDLGNVQNFGIAPDIASGTASQYVTPPIIRAMFGTINQTPTFATVEEALSSVPEGSLMSRVYQVSTNGPWRVDYYNLGI